MLGIGKLKENQGDTVASGLEPYGSWEACNVHLKPVETCT